MMLLLPRNVVLDVFTCERCANRDELLKEKENEFAKFSQGNLLYLDSLSCGSQQLEVVIMSHGDMFVGSKLGLFLLPR